jgi:2-oxo-4-hydroxy-4-carboxy-5-ureidoimidazoline decarboxylase
VAAAAPYRDLAGLQRAADAALAALDEADVDEALAGHPRIGERGDDPSSRREQAGVDDATRDALLAANRDYEARFGHLYLVRASGRTGEQLLALLRQRLANDPSQERVVVRDELGQINGLRLERLATEEAR